jgi:S-formylglutathione hydrolase FrmB
MQALNMPSVFGTSTAVRRANSPYDEIAPNTASLLANHTFFWMYTGTAEPSAHRQTLLFAAELHREGIPYLSFKAAGTHDWALWRSMMGPSLIAASDHLADG